MSVGFILTAITPKSEKKYGTHPTQKPIALLEHFIKLLSNPNDLVLDPFLGSGSTAVACKRLNRNFIGFDLNKDYCELAIKRVEND